MECYMKKLFKIITDLSDEPDVVISENTDLITDLGYDSLQFVQLLSDIEEAYQIEFMIDEIEIEKLRSMNILQNLIHQKVCEKANG